MPTVVARYRSRVEAELARGMLEAEGITVSVLVDEGETAGVHTVYEGGARLLARDEDVDRARALLAEVEPGSGSNLQPTSMAVWLTALVVLAAVLFLAVRVVLN